MATSKKEVLSNVSTKVKEPHYQIGVNSKQFCHDYCGKLVKESKKCFCIPPNNSHELPKVTPFLQDTGKISQKSAQPMPTETTKIQPVQSEPAKVPLKVQPEALLVHVKQGDLISSCFGQL